MATKLLVPGRGAALAHQIVAGSPILTALGPWPAGTYIDRIKVNVYCYAQAGQTGLRLGFGLSATGSIGLDNLNASVNLWRAAYGGMAFGRVYRLQLLTAAVFGFEVDVGIAVQGGAKYVLVYHDLEDGSDFYDLFVSVRTKVTADHPEKGD